MLILSNNLEFSFNDFLKVYSKILRNKTSLIKLKTKIAVFDKFKI